MNGAKIETKPIARSRQYRCRFVRAGMTRAAGGRTGLMEIRPEALEQACAAGLFNRRAVFLDHASDGVHPRLRNLVGVTTQAAWNPADEAVEGAIRLYPGQERLAALLDEVLAEGVDAPDVGLSLVFYPEYARREAGKRVINAIRYIESVDLVFEPAADGRLLAALDTASLAADNSPDSQSARCAGILFHVEGEEQMENYVIKSASPLEGEAHESPLETGASMSTESRPNATDRTNSNSHTNPAAWTSAAENAAVKVVLDASGLPQASRERLAAGVYGSPQALTDAIEAERVYLAKIVEANTVKLGGVAPRGGGIQVGLDGKDQITLALEALMLGTAPAHGVRPLSGIREAYIALSGDYEMTGVFHPERVQFTSVDSSTMAGLVANALNKSVVNMFQQYPRWWEKFTFQEDFQNLQQVKWITLGGVGDLPTVGEGSAYTELTWDDQTETASFVKKGGYLGLTLEAMDKDDTRKLQAAPRALAQSAWLTLSKAVSNIFTQSSGVGPTMSDSQALFHTNHANLGTTALSITSYAAARLAMRKQTELNSAERLGALTAPKYLLVPPDLEITALQVLASENDYTYALSNAPAGPVNALTEGNSFAARMAYAKDRVVVVDLWTDTNNWAAIADPMMYPSIGLGFRYGRTPEIFSVASPTAGLMFSNDVMPIKVRFFFAAGPTDWRGIYKANVA